MGVKPGSAARTQQRCRPEAGEWSRKGNDVQVRLPLRLLNPLAVAEDVASGLGQVTRAATTVMALVPRVEVAVGRLELVLDRLDRTADHADRLLDQAGRSVSGADSVIGRANRSVTGADAAVIQALATVAGANEVVRGAGRSVAAADEVVGRALSTTDAAAMTVGKADAVTEEAARLLAQILAPVEVLLPYVRQLVLALNPADARALGGTLNRLPAMIEDDVLPIVQQVGPDLHTLLGLVEELGRTLSAVPGVKRLKKHAAEE